MRRIVTLIVLVLLLTTLASAGIKSKQNILELMPQGR